MPPTGRRRARNNKEPEQRPDADAPDAATPSRKKRRLNGTTGNTGSGPTAQSTRRISAESDVTIDNDNGEDDDGELGDSKNRAEEVIEHLTIASYKVNAATDHSNTILPANVQAYAKIAGRTWTYYIRDTEVRIGRPFKSIRMSREAGCSDDVDISHSQSDPLQGDPSTMVNIDLGPDQQVSRLHAVVTYNADVEQWELSCNGRNGLFVDDAQLKRGTACNLRSGSVINILGTQMLFVLPNQEPILHPSIRKALLEGGEEEEDEYSHLPDGYANYGTNVRLRPVGAAGSGNGGDRSTVVSGAQGAHILASISSSQHQANAPGTPLRQAPQPKSKNSPAFGGRALMIETTDEIDYSHDTSKDIKPPHSYAQMIGQAIMSREEEAATLSQIYEFIRASYAYFRHGGGGWQNSIRHNLSLSKHFEKIPRRTDEPGKGMKWQIVPEHREEYLKKNFHDSARRPAQRRIGSSGPNSPATHLGAGAQTERLIGALNTSRVKAGSRSPSPSLHAYPAANAHMTPDRSARNIKLQTVQLPALTGAAPISAVSEINTPTFDRTHALAAQQTFSAGSRESDLRDGRPVDSPPVLTAIGFDGADHNNMYSTPLPARQAPKLHFSTIKPPSFYAKELFSSPAPFWKISAFPGSTPLRPMADLSPEKYIKAAPADDDEIKTDQDIPMIEATEKKEEQSEEKISMEDDEPEDAVPPPSSPLGKKAASIDNSPSRTVSRPASRREPAPAPAPGLLDKAPKFAFNPSALSAPSFKFFQHEAARTAVDEDEDDDGIDLTKGFQRIGTFHRAMNTARR